MQIVDGSVEVGHARVGRRVQGRVSVKADDGEVGVVVAKRGEGADDVLGEDLHRGHVVGH